MKTRIWNLIVGPSNDEGSETTWLSFDSEEAANATKNAVHRLEYDAYLSERDNWGVVPDEGKRYKTIETPDGRSMRSYIPPDPVSFEKWLAGEFTMIRDRGITMTHVYDQMHAPSELRVEPDWLHSAVPELVVLGAMVRTRDEFERIQAVLGEEDDADS